MLLVRPPVRLGQKAALCLRTLQYAPTLFPSSKLLHFFELSRKSLQLSTEQAFTQQARCLTEITNERGIFLIIKQICGWLMILQKKRPSIIALIGRKAIMSQNIIYLHKNIQKDSLIS